MVGFVAIHPGWPNSVVDAEYSERGTEAEVDGTLDVVGGEFLNAAFCKLRSRSISAGIERGSCRSAPVKEM
jgi:hypothetical protein